jgi:hypothetical protein
VLAISGCAEADGPQADPGVSSNIKPANEASPQAHSVEIGHGGGIDVEVGHGAVWVSTKEGVLRVDPATNLVVDEIPLEGYSTWTSVVTPSG